ncbi:tyrosine kinase receptor Cad96Ca-like [Asterias rubens]|uniref:tyrosine kinase receptor Cad96Ca-like n=1 Tax=Asterias rubens TaxID=7604 RepID=UPI0014553497|nr:tyrosine kinase receptor Cad96Ca-like [Asterias rubens]
MNLTRTTPHEIEGETTSFSCTVDELGEYGYLEWFLNDKPLDLRGADSHKQIYLNKTLYRNYSGLTLNCLTFGVLANVNKTLQLNVLHPPDVVTLDANLTSGLIYKFNCTASGANPAVKITWLLNISDVQSRKDIVSLSRSTAPYMWTTSSCLTLHTSTIVDVEGVRCMTSFLDNDSYVVRELPLDPIDKDTSFIPEASTTQPGKGTTSTDKSTYVKVYVIVTVSVAVCLCFAVMIVWRVARQPKPPQEIPTVNQDSEFSSWGTIEFEESRLQHPEVDFSFPRENIELLEVLGCGNFGQVYKAIAKDILEVGITTPVAVKILKRSSVTDVEADFKKEITVHETLTAHPNVVSMLGYCIETDPFYLILEFLPGGNLQDFLKKNKLSWKESIEDDLDVEPISPFQLLTFASQIANGMDYLSCVGCIHRDLASRNILLTEELVCKLSDFGLARDVSATDQYEMTSMGLLPVRWLAMECLVDNTYTTMSDVWSFGVLLWEIVTLGAHPYRGMTTNDIIGSLVEGYRLPHPAHCSRQVFSIMKECWKEVPRTRPTFISLKRTLDVMIADAPMYVNMSNFQPDKYI